MPLACFALALLLLPSTLSAQPPDIKVQGTDQLAFTTVQIEAFAGDTHVGRATGFFFLASQKRLFFFTNRHVVRDEQKIFYPDHLMLRLHTDRNDYRKSDYYKVQLYTDPEKKQPAWKELSPGTESPVPAEPEHIKEDKPDVVSIELPIQEMA